MSNKILEIKDLKVFYESPSSLFRTKSVVKAVNGVNININQGETFGLVGESGSGKSTVAKAVLNLVKSQSGTISLENEDLLNLKGKSLRRAQKDIGAIFQDPYSSLNPRMKVKDIISEPLKVQGLGKEATLKFNAELAASMHAAEQAALEVVGRGRKSI